MSWAHIKAEEICEAMLTSFRGKKLASVMMLTIVHVATEDRFVFIFIPSHSVASLTH